MPNIYITTETKGLIELLSKAESRTQDGEINHLCTQRIKELGLPDVNSPSVKASQCTDGRGKVKHKKRNAQSARAG